MRTARLVPAAAEAGKVGNVFIVNRLTGKLLRKSEPFVVQTANIFSAPSGAGATMLPGREWRQPMAAAGFFAAHP